jgi:ComF family protein
VDNFLKTKAFLKDLFFPKFCLGCNKEGTFLCQDCRHLLDILEVNFPAKNKFLDGLYFALSYKESGLCQKLIHNFKYPPYLKALAPDLANILIEHFIKIGKNTNEVWENSVLTPVPLHVKKLKERGYNHSQELARELGIILKIPVLTDILVKTKDTKSQVGLNKMEREKNLLGAFSLTKNPQSCGSHGFSKVFLVDDVYTTGSTMQECAKILKENGVKSVWGIAIARED